MGTRKGVTRLLTRHTKSCEQRGRKMFTLTAIPNIDFTELVLFLVERLPEIVAINIVLACLVKPRFRVPTLLFVPIALAIMILGTWTGSFESAAQQGYDLNEPSLRQALESYIETGDGDLNEILESGKYAPTFGQHELNYLIKDLLTHTLLHLDSHNAGNIPVAYNKGNDWFRATLGEPMVYTSGIYKHGNESLKEAQLYKLDYVANAIELKKGDSVLDIGCGWGRLVQHFSDKYGAKVMGVTLSSEQRKYGLDLNKHNDAQIHLQDAMAMSERDDLPEGGFDKITSLEMAEHVGIRRYNQFLTSVHDLLSDDGVFYFQVAGLRRQWQWEDLVWGLFMGEHVFPGADASCPLGWVSTHLERAGFEVQRRNHSLPSVGSVPCVVGSDRKTGLVHRVHVHSHQARRDYQAISCQADRQACSDPAPHCTTVLSNQDSDGCV